MRFRGDEFGPCAMCGDTIIAERQLCAQCVFEHGWPITDFGYTIKSLNRRKEAK